MQTISTGLVLKKGKDRPIRQHHHWIYSGAIKSSPKENNAIVAVFSSDGEKLGLAALNRGRSIAAHMLSFGKMSLEDALRERIRQAFKLRKVGLIRHKRTLIA